MRIGEKVRSKLKEKTWTFQEISNVAEIITTMSNEMYDDLDVKSKVDLIWDVPIYEDMLFGEFFQGEVLRQLNNKIADIIKAPTPILAKEFSFEQLSLSSIIIKY